MLNPPDPLLARLDALRQQMAQARLIEMTLLQQNTARLVAEILAQPRHAEPGRLLRHGWKAWSQNDEDGIIAEIFARIGTTNRQFLEFGVQTGLECNTLLLLHRGWRGAWIEANARDAFSIRDRFKAEIAAGTLKLREAMVTVENFDTLVGDLMLPRDLDLLSIDIDGNDWHVWRALTVLKPRVVVIEYNAKFPPDLVWTVAYDPGRAWDGSDYFGASLAAHEALGRDKGYALVGCNITGSNAFFVRDDQPLDRFAGPFTALHHYEPARYHLTAGFSSGHRPGHGPAHRFPPAPSGG